MYLFPLNIFVEGLLNSHPRVCLLLAEFAVFGPPMPPELYCQSEGCRTGIVDSLGVKAEGVRPRQGVCVFVCVCMCACMCVRVHVRVRVLVRACVHACVHV